MRAPDLPKGLVAGVAGGLLASFLMEQFQAFWSWTSEELKSNDAKESEKDDAEEPATIKTAQAISQSLTGQKIPKKNRPAAGEAVHYAMGAMSGAVYGVAAELIPFATAGEGLAFGASVWMAADNAIVPALGLGSSPTKTPASTHIYALASHLVYGVATEAVRRAVRSAL